MIIIEGPDHVGKTTAAKSLCKMGNRAYRHMEVPPDNWNWDRDFVRRIDDDVVQDRFHLGGIAYGMLCGFHSVDYSLYGFRELLQRIDERCFVVIMTASVPFFIGKYGEKEEMYEDIDEVVDAYSLIVEQGTFFGDPMFDLVHEVDVEGYPDEEVLETWMELYEKKLFRATRQP